MDLIGLWYKGYRAWATSIDRYADVHHQLPGILYDLILGTETNLSIEQ